MDLVFLSRLQFALTIMFHYLFPPLSIGLGLIMVIIEARFLRTGDPAYETLARFWTRIFAVNFAVGVATGIVMEFEFGTNWAVYSRFVGDVFGSALAAEGIFAFFLESGFLAVLVFGWDRVSRRTHFISTVMVFLGSMFSAVWIVIANSWQQTPAGYHIVGHGAEARAEITDFWAMVFNPSSMHRLGHVLLGSFIQGAFFVLSVSAWYILKKQHEDLAKRCFRIALVVAAASSIAILVSGHEQARAVARNQPAKLATFEGHFRTERGGTGMYLFGIPDVKARKVRDGIEIPGMLSYLVYDDASRPVTALDRFPPDELPPVQIPFQSYHLMVALGMFFIGVSLLGLFLLWRNKLFQKRWLMWVFVAGVIGPIIANESGWVAAEVGRQPWVVYGLLRTSDAVSAVLVPAQVLSSIIMFGLLYLALGVIWVMVLHSKIQHGPEPLEEPPEAGRKSFFDAASIRQDHELGYSLTDTEHEKED